MYARVEGLASRVLLALASLAPAAFLLGMPLPLKLRSLAGDEVFAAWAWAVNGFASVAGSVLAVVATMTLGFRATLALAAAAYALALVAHRLSETPAARRRERRPFLRGADLR